MPNHNQSNQCQGYIRQESISRTDLREAERMLNGALVNKWDEQVRSAIDIGIDLKNWDDYLRVISKTLSIPQDMADEMEKVKYLDQTQTKCFEFNVDVSEAKSLYAFIWVVKQGEKLHCAYFYHTLEFRLAKRQVEVVTEEKTGWGPFKKSIKKTAVVEEDELFHLNKLESVKEAFMKNQAMKQVKDDGFIEAIEYH